MAQFCRMFKGTVAEHEDLKEKTLEEAILILMGTVDSILVTGDLGGRIYIVVKANDDEVTKKDLPWTVEMGNREGIGSFKDARHALMFAGMLGDLYGRSHPE